MANLFFFCFSTGVFPFETKIAKFIPSYKKIIKIEMLKLQTLVCL